jgi:prepilin-type N-terminal cleavage/methylation domain-containing protein
LPGGKAWSMMHVNKVGTRRLRQGFTLIELLVVVAIIAVLLAVMLPSLGRAKQIARVLVCKSHLKNIPAACHMYLDDHDGYFLQGVNRNFTYGGWEGKYFVGSRRPFNAYLDLPAEGAAVSDAKVFKCPGDNGRDVPSGMVYFDDMGTSYQTNVLLIGPDQVNVAAFPTPLGDELNRRLRRLNVSQVNHPSQLLLAGDSEWGTQWEPNGPEGIVWHYRPGHFCVAFLDGHVEYLHIPKGAMCGPGYCVLPFGALCSLAPPPP